MFEQADRQTSIDFSEPTSPAGTTPAPRRGWRSTAAGVIGLIEPWYSDEAGNISRPKLLFSVAGLDIAIIIITGLIGELIFGETGFITLNSLIETFVVAVATVTLLRGYWSYTIHGLRSGRTQASKVAKATFVIFSIIAGAMYMANYELLTPGATLFWLTSSLTLIVLQRAAVATFLDDLTKQGRLVRRTVIVGGGSEAEKLILRLAERSAGEIQILGIFDDRFDSRSGESVSGYKKLGNFDQLSAFCRDTHVDLLIVTIPPTAEVRLLQILKQLFTLPVDIRISAQSSKLRLNSKAYSHVGGIPMLAVMDRPLTDWERVEKNLEDRIIGILCLLLASPVMIAVAIAIRLEGSGPIFFKQRRYGFNNELIEVWKFRSLKPASADANAAKLVTKDDPRVTRVGRFIRKTSLDELPQLFNVLRGEMSLVGPRPHATQAKANNDLYQSVVDGYFARHRMKPGVTGWAQINGWRGETDTHEKILGRVEADLYYIDNWSVLLDLYIIAMTPIALVSDKNAY